jgi:hypothetical protein
VWWFTLQFALEAALNKGLCRSVRAVCVAWVQCFDARIFVTAPVSTLQSHPHYRDCPSGLIAGQRVRVPMLDDFYGYAENEI